MNTNEEWRTIQGFDGYEVSNYGRVRSKDRIITIKRASCTYTRRSNGALLKFFVDKDGYYSVVLYDNVHKRGFHKRVSRLVAENFIQNPKNYPMVNHIDRNRKNNRADNLEWCDAAYNANYMFAPALRGLDCRNKINPKAVAQYDFDGNEICAYLSISEAQRQTGINAGHICQCCKGKYSSAGGFKWRYV